MKRKIPRPDPASRKRLNELARKMIDQATCDSNPRVLSATGFAREDISIIHQQIRATNLAWALGHSGRVRTGDVIAIVGGSFSGLTIAVILALVNDAIVYVFEKGDELLPRFRDKAHRHLSPNLNSRALGPRFDPTSSAPEFRSPIFAWSAGRASDVAASWANEFAKFDRKLPVFVFRNTEVRAEMIGTTATGLTIDFRLESKHLAPVDVDLLIDAAGFGEEANPLGVTDFSYWESGHRLIYDHLVTPARVLISGCGDSGVIEALHYAIADFRHEYVEALWRSYSGLEATIDEGLARARLDHILKSDERERYNVPVLSELVWWLDQRHFMATNTVPWPPGNEPYAPPIFEAVNDFLRGHFEAACGSGSFVGAAWEELEDFLPGLPLDAQLEARALVRPIADEWISLEIERLAATIPLPPDIQELLDMARRDIDIVLNGLTPTAYTRQLSPYNVWLMRLLLEFPSVNYRGGAIDSVDARQDRRFDVAFRDGSVDDFDRVCTRYGPSRSNASGIARDRPRDTSADDWLLMQPWYVAPDPLDPSRNKYFYPARAGVVAALDGLDRRRGRSTDVSKRVYGTRIRLGPHSCPDHPIYNNPQSWLSAELRAGRRPAYAVDETIDQQLTRR
jgi:hypothetical protein